MGRGSSFSACVAAIICSGISLRKGGPGCRWVGNESGFAGATNWSFLRAGEVYPGYPKYRELQYGHADGNQWTAAECDVSMRPGWFYHPEEDDKVKTVAGRSEVRAPMLRAMASTTW